jgi:hypothetical protein
VAPPAKPGAAGDKAALATDAAKPAGAGKGGQTTLKYEMEHARCEDRVVVLQDPTDPAKSPRGMKILGSKLDLDHSAAGSVMKVYGWPGAGKVAQVHYEDLSLYGPFVVIDQPDNAVSVDGRGLLRMPGGEADGGESPDQKPMDLEIYFSNRMRFYGAKAKAEFIGEVQATQLPSREHPRPKVEVAPAPRDRAVVALRVPLTGSNRLTASMAPQPAPAATAPGDDGTEERMTVLCHRLDVTFDRPVYFNEFGKTGGKPTAPTTGLAGTAPKGEAGGNPKLKTALCTPMPDDEAAELPRSVGRRPVVYVDETRDRRGKVVKAQRILCRQLDLGNDPKQQKVIATGPGEVRILQLGSKGGFGQPATPPQPGRPGQPAAPSQAKRTGQPGEQEMKLTLVLFPSRMVGYDKNKVYREAVFDDGADVFNTPTENINLDFPLHSPPRGTVTLRCTDNLTVSSSQTKKDAPADQQLVATGNATFQDDDYNGLGTKITYDEQKVTLEGSSLAPARLEPRQVRLNNQDVMNAQKFFYYRDGRIMADRAGTGSFSPK